jgi:hypothetical protein
MPATAVLRTVVLVLVGVSGGSFGALAMIPPVQRHYLVFGLVLCAGGALLTWVGVTSRRVGRIAWLATVVLCVAGLFLSLFVVREDVCCAYGYHRGLGFPWGWLDSSATVDSAAEVKAIQADPSQLATQLDTMMLGLDAAFWWYAAVVLVVPASRALQGWPLRRSRTAPSARTDNGRTTSPSPSPTYAQARHRRVRRPGSRRWSVRARGG